MFIRVLEAAVGSGVAIDNQAVATGLEALAAHLTVTEARQGEPVLVPAKTNCDLDEHIEAMFIAGSLSLNPIESSQPCPDPPPPMRNDLMRQRFSPAITYASSGTLFDPGNPDHVAGKAAFERLEDTASTVNTCISRML